MVAGIREIRDRIRAVRATQQITKAMKMVSAAKLRRVQSGTADAQRYAQSLHVMLRQALAAVDEPTHPLITARQEIHSVCCVLFLGDRGLCGTYNQDMLRYALDFYRRQTCPTFFYVVGRWGGDLIRRAQLPVRELPFACSDTPTAQQARQLTVFLKNLYLESQADQVYLLYQAYHSGLRQTPQSLCLLPAALRGEEEGTDYLFEPSPGEVLGRLVEAELEAQVFSVLRQSRMGEHAARLIAMSAATDTTEELIDKLSLALNRARQSTITTEISEIVGGANALQENGE